jgi:hypothetical protein
MDNLDLRFAYSRAREPQSRSKVIGGRRDSRSLVVGQRPPAYASRCHASLDILNRSFGSPPICLLETDQLNLVAKPAEPLQ